MKWWIGQRETGGLADSMASVVIFLTALCTCTHLPQCQWKRQMRKTRKRSQPLKQVGVKLVRLISCNLTTSFQVDPHSESEDCVSSCEEPGPGLPPPLAPVQDSTVREEAELAPLPPPAPPPFEPFLLENDVDDIPEGPPPAPPSGGMMIPCKQLSVFFPGLRVFSCTVGSVIVRDGEVYVPKVTTDRVSKRRTTGRCARKYSKRSYLFNIIAIGEEGSRILCQVSAAAANCQRVSSETP